MVNSIQLTEKVLIILSWNGDKNPKAPEYLSLIEMNQNLFKSRQND